MTAKTKILVTGAGGFIGGHLVNYLSQKGYWVRGVDIKQNEFMEPLCDDFKLLDLRRSEACMEATQGIDEVYSLAANMGGIGFIDSVHADVMHDNALININMLEAAVQKGVTRYFYSSSACVYPTYRQDAPDVEALAEDAAYPAAPDSQYGWEKLFTERLCAAYRRDKGLQVRVGRYHNIYGPYGTWTGGREKAPAALMRKAVEASDPGTIPIWGDGQQTRSFCYIDDCLEGTYRLMRSDYDQPLNIGSAEVVTIDKLAALIIELTGKRLKLSYEVNGPQGVRGRCSDNTRIGQVLGWSPSISLVEGIRKTFPWIEAQVHSSCR